MLRRLLAVLLVLTNSACGTLFSGVNEDVRVTATPADAQVTFYQLSGEKVVGPAAVNDGPIRTPRTKHGVPYLSVATLPGYCPAYQVTKGDVTPGLMAEVLLLAIPFIQVIGAVAMAVDNATGGCCKIVPLEVVLEPEASCP